MKKSFWYWTGWFLFLLLLDLTVPFIWLKNVSTYMGSFLFWIIWIVIAIISMFIMFLRWREDE